MKKKMQTEAGDFGNFFTCVLVHNYSTAIPKREGKGVLPRPSKPYSPEPKARRPFCQLVFLFFVTSI